MRIRVTKSVVASLSFLVVVALVFGCSQNSPTGVSNQSPGTLTVSENIHDRTLHAEFTRDGHGIKIEMRRGPAVLDCYREAIPPAPEFEVDLRVSDADGAFFVMYGGHSAQDPSWNDPADDAKTAIVEPVARQRSFELMQEALVKLAAYRGDPAFGMERQLLAAVAHNQALDFDRDLSEPVPQSPTFQAGSYRYHIEIHKQPVKFLLTVGEHSATWLKVYSPTGTLLKEIVTSNHGTAANAMPTVQCRRDFYRSTYIAPVAYSCSTPYGFFAKQHVCNDDSYIQYVSVRDQVCPCTTCGTCSDWSLRAWAPSCF